MTTNKILSKLLEAQFAIHEVSVYCKGAVDKRLREKIMDAKFHIAEAKSAVEIDRVRFNHNMTAAISLVETIADRSSRIPETALNDIDNCLSILREIGAEK